MNTEQQLRAAVSENPSDFTAHGALADYLEESGGDPSAVRRRENVLQAVLSSGHPASEIIEQNKSESRALDDAGRGSPADKPVHEASYPVIDGWKVRFRSFGGRGGPIKKIAVSYQHPSGEEFHGTMEPAALQQHMKKHESFAAAKAKAADDKMTAEGNARASGQKPMKLALVNATKFKIARHDTTDRLVLADHMQDEGDPREHLLRREADAKEMYWPARRTWLYRPHPRFQKEQESADGNHYTVDKFHTFPDGTQMFGTWYTKGHVNSGVPEHRLDVAYLHDKNDPYNRTTSKWTVPEFDAWIDTFPEDERARLRETFGHPEPVKAKKPPVKLARKPGGLFSKIASIFSKPVAGRTEKDGIIHKGDTTDGFVKAFAEKSAVAGALQKLGYRQTNPEKHRERVQLFTDVAHSLHTHFPDFQPVAHYRAAAEKLNAPDVVKPTPNPTQLGEWPEPERNVHYTVPNVGPAGQDLVDAATPMVRAIDRILEQVRPGHVALDRAHDDPAPTLADEAKPPKPKEPVEPKLAISKPKGDGFAIGLADMRKFKKELRGEPKAAETTVDLNAPEEQEKIPLVNYPGEVGPTGDRWFDIHKLASAGKGRAEIVSHLVNKFGLSPRNAAATIARFDKAAATFKAMPRKKKIKFARLFLARVKGVTDRDITGKGIDKQIGGSRFAFHLRQIAHEFKDIDPTLSKMAMHALTLNGRYATGKEGDVYARIGKRLSLHAAGSADHVHNPMAKALRKFSPDAGSDYDLARTATPAQKKVALAEAIKAQAKVEGGQPFAEATATRPEAEWDDFRRRAAARHFKAAYNWHKVNDGLLLDKHVADFLAANLKGHTDENDLHEKASRSFDLYRGAAKSRAPDWHEKFWSKITKHVRSKIGGGYSADKINESLARLSDRAVERREVGKDPDWKRQFHWVGGSKHMKFYRGYWLCH